MTYLIEGIAVIITEDNGDILYLEPQQDRQGTKGDVKFVDCPVTALSFECMRGRKR